MCLERYKLRAMKNGVFPRVRVWYLRIPICTNEPISYVEFFCGSRAVAVETENENVADDKK